MVMLWMSTALGAVLTVPGDHDTVTEAVAAASDGDTIELGPGDWSGEEVSVSGMALTFTSSDGVEETTGPVVSGTSADLTFSELTVPCDVGNWLVYGGSLTASEVYATRCGGALVTVDATMTVSDSTFESNLGARGAALYAGGDLTVSDSTFTDNGVIALLDLSDTCDDDACGGAIFATGGDVTISDCAFSGSAADNGGHIYLADDLGDVEITGSTFSDGSSDDMAGAIFVFDADELVMHDVSFDGHESTDGAAVTLSAVNTVEISSARFVENTGKGDGGALSIVDGTLATVTSSWFCGNEADGDGADIAVTDNFGLLVYGTAFGLSEGDASITLGSAALDVTNATFAGPSGSAIVGSGGLTITATNVLFLDHADYAAELYDGAAAVGSYNALYADDGLGWVFDGWEEDLTEDSMEGVDPLVQAYGSSCDDLVLWLGEASPLRDAGDPSIEDVDGSSSDIGAFGGPWADLTDADGDGYYEDLDCDDTEEDIHPDAEEIADDGIDQDCDGEDLVTSETDTEVPSDTEAPTDTEDSDTEQPTDTEDTDTVDTDTGDTDSGEGCQGCAAGAASPLWLGWVLPLVLMRRRSR